MSRVLLKLVKLKDDDLVLWAESPEEARTFMRRVSCDGTFPKIDRIFIAKKSPKHIRNKYIEGEYYETSDDRHVDVINNVVIAPSSVKDLVQWCTPDAILSRGYRPVVSVEDTTHIVRMNLYQRIPRLAKAAVHNVPSVVLQGTYGLEFSKAGDRAALYRYLQAFEGMARRHPHYPPMPFWYLPDAVDEKRAETEMTQYISALLRNDYKSALSQQRTITRQIANTVRQGIQGTIPEDLPSISYKGKEVVVKIGANPEVKSWKSKGSGQMDPYVGMILAAKYMYCYDVKGNQSKKLVVHFTKLPQDFWWFRNAETSTSLYKRLPFEFADEIRWKTDNQLDSTSDE